MGSSDLGGNAGGGAGITGSGGCSSVVGEVEDGEMGMSCGDVFADRNSVV